jgi:hypothetical protein
VRPGSCGAKHSQAGCVTMADCERRARMCMREYGMEHACFHAGQRCVCTPPCLHARHDVHAFSHAGWRAGTCSCLNERSVLSWSSSHQEWKVRWVTSRSSCLTDFAGLCFAAERLSGSSWGSSSSCGALGSFAAASHSPSNDLLHPCCLLDARWSLPGFASWGLRGRTCTWESCSAHRE